MSGRKTIPQMLREFHDRYAPVTEPPFGGTSSTRRRLLAEECQEYQDAEDAQNLENVVKELADIVYVAYGTAHCYGFDLDAAVAAVHESNMTKDMPLTPGGKAVKGPGYKEANLSGALTRIPERHAEQDMEAEAG